MHAYGYHPPKQANIKVVHIDRWHPSLHGYLDLIHHALNRSVNHFNDWQSEATPAVAEASEATCNNKL